MAIISSTVLVGQKPTEEQQRRIEELAKRPIHYTDDCPASTREALEQFAMQRAEKNRQKEKERETVSISLTSDCLGVYRALGKGYTSIMADVLTYAASHPEVLRQAAL